MSNPRRSTRLREVAAQKEQLPKLPESFEVDENKNDKVKKPESKKRTRSRKPSRRLLSSIYLMYRL